MYGEHLKRLLSHVEIPPLAQIQVPVDTTALSPTDIKVTVGTIMAPHAQLFQPQTRIAITVGSRGISGLVEVVQGVVNQVKQWGAVPYIVPAMGSHGKNAQGQREILAHLGVDESTMGCAIVSDDALVSLGIAADGRPVYVDAFAWSCDGIVVINRIKGHTAFRAPVESGLMKMLAVGLGKQKGADACHSHGFDGMYQHVQDTANHILSYGKVLLGVGLLENSSGQLRHIEAVAGDSIAQCEPVLLRQAMAWMPKLPIQDIDVLIVDEMGKNISGSGMDTNIIGRYPTEGMTGGPTVGKLAVLRLTPESHGSAHGVGFADFTTKALFDAYDMDMTYPNGLTNKVTGPAKIPMVLPDDKTAIQAAIHCTMKDADTLRVVRIRNTHQVSQLQVSAPVAKELQLHPDFAPLPFDQADNLSDLYP